MTADPSVRRLYLVPIRSPRAAFVVPFLTSSAANRRARIARARGWSAQVREVDGVAVDGSSLDPLDLPEPPDEVEAPRRRRRGRRSARARLLADEEAAATGADVAVDLTGFDRPGVVELDGDEDLDERGRPWSG
ncbi:hypothetical protein [Kineococcus arenarius]|uniref:hypothetical protein n=1 Tax=unclassified Kineococcus TaxID=2621656 RepID=UPI003D7D9EE0